MSHLTSTKEVCSETLLSIFRKKAKVKVIPLSNSETHLVAHEYCPSRASGGLTASPSVVTSPDVHL